MIHAESRPAVPGSSRFPGITTQIFVGLVLGVDQILDMGRTAVNVMGNCIATAVVARWEGVFDDARMRAFASEPSPMVA